MGLSLYTWLSFTRLHSVPAPECATGCIAQLSLSLWLTSHFGFSRLKAHTPSSVSPSLGRVRGGGGRAMSSRFSMTRSKFPSSQRALLSSLSVETAFLDITSWFVFERKALLFLLCGNITLFTLCVEVELVFLNNTRTLICLET